MFRTTRVWTLAFVITAFVACDIPVRPQPQGGPEVTRLDVSPKNVIMQQYQVADFTVIGFTSTGDTADVAINWSVNKGSITDTSSDNGRHRGRYRAGADTGKVKIVAKGNGGGPADTADVTITEAPVTTVVVSPAAASIAIGVTVQLSAAPQDLDGNPLPDRVVTWASTNPGVATVTSGGLVRGVAAGAATVTVSCEGQTGAVAITVTVVPVATVAVSPASGSVTVGQTVQLTATPKDANGNALSGRTVTWATNNAAVATVNGSGLVTGVAAGSATITATSEGKSGTASVTVSAVPVASVTVTPASASAQVGQSVQLTATPKDANGNPLTGRVVAWTSSAPSIATVSVSGLVTGVAAGSATITATSEGKNGTSALTITAPPPPTGCSVRCRYVDAVVGNDANPGTSTAPWRTLQRAADLLSPGDTAIVNDGVYTGGTNVVSISRSGTATAWLVFRAANRWGAKIDGRNFSSVMGIAINGNYIRVEGFEVYGTSRTGIEPYGGREDIAGNHDIIVTQNHVHDIGHICTSSSGGIVGIAAYSDNLTIDRNVIHDIGRLAPGEQGCNPSNTYWQNHDHGIYNGVGNNVVIRNNVFYNITHGWAIQRYNGDGSVTTGLTIVNNTFVFPNPWRDGHIIIGTTTNNLVIANNIFYQPTTAGVWFDGAGNGATLVGNVSSDALQTGGSGLTLSGNLQNTDPLFVNTTAFNFRLAAGSPARSTGVAAWCPTIDFDGVARTGTCSAGAYQN